MISRVSLRRARCSVILLLAMGLATPAAAGVTVDLVWADTGTATLTVDPGDIGNHACDGFNSAPLGRCMKVLWRTGGASLSSGDHSVAWDPSSGLTAEFASLFSAYAYIPMGKAATLDPGPPPTIRNDLGEVQGIAAASTYPANIYEPTGLPAGTYTIATIIWDVAAATAGSHALTSFLRAEDGGFLDSVGAVTTDYQLNGATLHVTPEPGRALLLTGGLVALARLRRRSRTSSG